VVFYEDASGLPGAIVPGCDYPAVTTFTGGATGSFVTTLSPPCNLTPGTKWVSVQANQNFNPAGQWAWTMRDVQSFNPAAWRNPGGGFPGGCTSYTARGSCEPATASSPDQVFRLEGLFAGCTVDADCQDGNLCNGTETCVNEVCTPGTSIDCSDGQFCTLDTCDPATGTCGHPPNPCDDGDGCTTDSCNEAGDTCVNAGACVQVCNPGPIAVNDTQTPPTPANPYPSDISVSGVTGSFSLVSVQLLGIAHTFPDDVDVLLVAPNAAGNAILMSDVGGGVPVTGVNLTLADGAPPIPDTGPLVSGTFSPTNVNPGTGTEAWPAPAPPPSGNTSLALFNGADPNGNWSLYVVDDQGIDSGSFAGGWCLNYRAVGSGCTADAQCNDNNDCTTDTCNTGTGACVFTNNTNPCSDGNACTSNDTCGGGTCNAGPPTVCNDNNVCTTDTCNPSTGCVFTNNTNPCNDGNACTNGDTCGGGTCNGGPPAVCNDNNVCTTDTCSPSTGCVFTNNTNPCNDGNGCTTGDTCGGGTCNGTPVVCAPADQCHEAGVCNSGSGTCSYANKPNGTTCDDGNSSTSGDSCQGGVCTGSSCTSTNDPKTKGWYKSLCHHAHSGDALTDADAACVGALTATFAGISTVADICAVLEPSSQNNDSCGKAEDQLMVLALNICRQRVCASSGIDSDCGNNGTVAQSLAQSDAIFDDPSRTTATCNLGECLDKEINNGHALELDSLLLVREGANVRLNWTAPILDDGSGNPRFYRIWRRTAGSLSPFVVIGTTTTLTYLDSTSGTIAREYNVTPVN
jgi:hypothetical protein